MSRKSQHVNLIISLIVFASTVGVVILMGFFFLSEEPEIIQGQVEVSEYRVSSKVAGRILELRVREGDTVHQGDTLALIEAPEVDAKSFSAQAAENAASALSQMANKGARDEQIQGALEMWNTAQAGLEIAQKSYERVKRLFEEGVLPAQKKDEAEAGFKAAQARERAAKSQYDMAVNGARREEKMAAAEKVNMAKGNVELLDAYRSEMVQCASHDGVVSEIYPKLGELVGTGSPIMTVAMDGEIWGSFNVREDQLKGLKSGDVLQVYVPALDKEIEMKVYYLKDQGSYAVWKATKTTGQYDLKTFEVRALPTTHVEGLCAGMSLILR